MQFYFNTHIIARGDHILYNDKDITNISDTEGFAGNSGGELVSEWDGCR
jgi:hypothetical protein